MKKVVILLTMLLCLCINYTYAQVSKTVHVETAGQLSSLLTDEEKATITDLTVTGNIDLTDIRTLNDSMLVLAVIDLNDAILTNGNLMPICAFNKKHSLRSVTLPSSLTSFMPMAFYECSGLNSINISSTNMTYSSIDGVLYSKDYKKIIQCPNGKTGAYRISDSVQIIGEQAFSYCTGLTHIILPPGVTTIETEAFSYCSGLTQVYIPSSVKTIEGLTFYQCSELTYVSIPSSVKSILTRAFSGCSSLITINLPSSVTDISYDAFTDCYKLTGFSVSESNSAYSSVDGILFNKDKTEIIRYPCTREGDYSIPNSVASIGLYAFSDCRGLASVNIPSSVITINRSAFMNCSSLTSLTIPSSVTSISDEAFIDCTGLISISIPNSVKHIGSSAFANCINLTSITIPPVSYIAPETFHKCSSLTSITIPSSVEYILSGAFGGCSGLTSISIASSVTSISYWAFANCSNLELIRVYSPDPVKFDLEPNFEVFLGIPTNSCKLFVPKGSKPAYAAADQWKDFINIIEFEYSLSLSDTTVFTAGSGEKSSFINILSNTNWTISTDQSWLSVGNTSGTNDGMIVVTAEANPGATERTATITVSGTGVNSQTVNVTQAANNLTSISENRIETLTLYPNPVSTVLFIDSAVGYEMGIYNIQGSMLLKKTLESDHESIDFSAMQPGMYLVKIGEKSYKVVK